MRKIFIRKQGGIYKKVKLYSYKQNSANFTEKQNGKYEKICAFARTLLNWATSKSGRETLETGVSQSQLIAWLDCRLSIILAHDEGFPEGFDFIKVYYLAV